MKLYKYIDPVKEKQYCNNMTSGEFTVACNMAWSNDPSDRNINFLGLFNFDAPFIAKELLDIVCSIESKNSNTLIVDECKLRAFIENPIKATKENRPNALINRFANTISSMDRKSLLTLCRKLKDSFRIAIDNSSLDLEDIKTLQNKKKKLDNIYVGLRMNEIKDYLLDTVVFFAIMYTQILMTTGVYCLTSIEPLDEMSALLKKVYGESCFEFSFEGLICKDIEKVTYVDRRDIWIEDIFVHNKFATQKQKTTKLDGEIKLTDNTLNHEHRLLVKYDIDLLVSAIINMNHYITVNVKDMIEDNFNESRVNIRKMS